MTICLNQDMSYTIGDSIPTLALLLRGRELWACKENGVESTRILWPHAIGVPIRLLALRRTV